MLTFFRYLQLFSSALNTCTFKNTSTALVEGSGTSEIYCHLQTWFGDLTLKTTALRNAVRFREDFEGQWCSKSRRWRGMLFLFQNTYSNKWFKGHSIYRRHLAGRTMVSCRLSHENPATRGFRMGLRHHFTGSFWEESQERNDLALGAMWPHHQSGTDMQIQQIWSFT